MAFLVMLFYACIINGELKSHARKCKYWTFSLEPRPIPMFFLCILLTPCMLSFFNGRGISEGWYELYSIRNDSRFIIFGNSRPTKRQCYIKAVE